MQVRIPADVEVPMRLFGQFTLKDIARLGIPPGLVYVWLGGSGNPLNTILPVIAAALVGVAWYKSSYKGLKLDELVYHAVRWTGEKRELEGTDVDKVEKRYIKTENGDLVAFVRVDSVNLSALDSLEQESVHQVYADLLDSINFPIEVHSRQERFDLREYTQSLKNLGETPEALRRGYINHCRKLSRGELVTTKHYISVKASPQNIQFLKQFVGSEKAKTPERVVASELDSRCREVLKALNRGDLSADRVHDDEMYEVAKELSHFQPGTQKNWTTTPVQDQDGEYRKTLYITEYPSPARLGWVCDVMRVNGLVDVTQVIQPKEPGETVSKLETLSEKLTAEIESFLTAGYIGGVRDLERRLDDTNWLLNLLVDRSDRPFRYAVYITVHDTDKERCEQTLEAVETRLKTSQTEYEHTLFRTDKALRTYSPLHTDGLNQKLLMPTRSVAAALPFATQDTNHGSGVVYGMDTTDGVPLLLDRFSWDSSDSVRFGKKGSGKSYASKLELIRSWLSDDDLQIIVIDPKQEYGELVETLSNTENPVHGLDEEFSLDNRITSFEPEERGQDADVPKLVRLVEQLYRETSQDTRRTLVLIDEAHQLMNHEKGRGVLAKWVREARDTNTALSLVSQNVADFTYCREGRAILDNTQIKVFHYHDRVPDHAVDYFDLSRSEVRQLKNLKTGGDTRYSEAVLKVSGQVNTTLRITASRQEHEIIESSQYGQ
ncbi:DUF87 domain-containing protein [Halobacteria archaeon AArc-curdl1]|uniref:DUF87 domain-containing protein n=1 Tax=Natronosalvus hydrolyticus TaxID=2979988 RepID=A0AAP2ZAZ4_9EURY|nr:DUF87 domain-containing protein [Halobacteria archaeon AArc-curdl1]